MIYIQWNVIQHAVIRNQYATELNENDLHRSDDKTCVHRLCVNVYSTFVWYKVFGLQFICIKKMQTETVNLQQNITKPLQKNYETMSFIIWYSTKICIFFSFNVNMIFNNVNIKSNNWIKWLIAHIHNGIVYFPRKNCQSLTKTFFFLCLDKRKTFQN